MTNMMFSGTMRYSMDTEFDLCIDTTPGEGNDTLLLSVTFVSSCWMGCNGSCALNRRTVTLLSTSLLYWERQIYVRVMLVMATVGPFFQVSPSKVLTFKSLNIYLPPNLLYSAWVQYHYRLCLSLGASQLYHILFYTYNSILICVHDLRLLAT